MKHYIIRTLSTLSVLFTCFVCNYLQVWRLADLPARAPQDQVQGLRRRLGAIIIDAPPCLVQPCMALWCPCWMDDALGMPYLGLGVRILSGSCTRRTVSSLRKAKQSDQRSECPECPGG